MQAKYIAKIIFFFLVVMPISAQTPEKPVKKPHIFFDKTNIALFSADALVRSLDAQSTRSFMTNPCKCIHENSLPDAIVSSTPKMYAYSLGVSAALVGISYLAHKTHHHRIERFIPAADIVYDGHLAMGNYSNISAASKYSPSLEGAGVESKPVFR